jgi:5'-nucleotidase
VSGERLAVRAILACTLAALQLACATPSPPRPSPLPEPDEVRITLVHINDVYEIGPVEGGRAGGLARVATLLRRLEAQNPNTVMLLGGDFLSPSAIGTARLRGERLAGRQMVSVLNATGLDLAVYGNHEFDLSAPELGRRISESRFGWIGTNVTDTLGAPLFGTPRHAILRFPGPDGTTVRVGVVGVVIDQNRRPWVRYQSPIASIRREIALIRDSVDAIVALTHLTVGGDVVLADSIPELDVILGGHEHENWSLRRGPRFTPIIKADANVRSVAVVSLGVRPRARATVDWRLVTITDSVPAEPAVAAIVAAWTDSAYAAFRQDGLDPDRLVANTPVALDARETVIRNSENDFTRLLTASLLAEAPEAQVALFNSGSVRLDDILAPGPVTEYDVIRLLPFGGKVVVADMPGALLARALDQGDLNRGIGGFLFRSGVERTGEGWRVAGAPLDTLRRYQVVTTDFLVSGGEQNMSWFRSPALTLERTLRDVRLVVIDEIKRRFPAR